MRSFAKSLIWCISILRLDSEKTEGSAEEYWIALFLTTLLYNEIVICESSYVACDVYVYHLVQESSHGQYVYSLTLRLMSLQPANPRRQGRCSTKETQIAGTKVNQPRASSSFVLLYGSLVLQSRSMEIPKLRFTTSGPRRAHILCFDTFTSACVQWWIFLIIAAIYS